MAIAASSSPDLAPLLQGRRSRQPPEALRPSPGGDGGLRRRKRRHKAVDDAVPDLAFVGDARSLARDVVDELCCSAAAAGRLPVEARGPAAALCSYRPGRAPAAAGGCFYGWGPDAEARGVALGVAGRQHGCFVSGGALRRVASSPTRATPRRREGRACGRAGGRGRDGQPPSG